MYDFHKRFIIVISTFLLLTLIFLVSIIDLVKKDGEINQLLQIMPISND